MTNLYNAKVSYKGEGSFTFTMPYYGEVTIYPNKDIYMKNLTQQGVEALRALRPTLLEHQLNAKPDGCYTYIDFNETNNIIPTKMQLNYREVVSNKSVAEMKAEMIKSTGPIEEPVELPKIEEPQEESIEDVIPTEDYVLTSTKHKGKKLSELSKSQIKGNLNRFNDADLKFVKAYLDE